MTEVPRPERIFQNRVIVLFADPTRPDGLGYRMRGEQSERESNSPIDAPLWRVNLKQRGYSVAHQRIDLATPRHPVNMLPCRWPQAFGSPVWAFQ